MTDRIQELERQVGELQREIATLRGDKPAARVVPPPPDEGVRILRLEERTSFVRPTKKELHTLLAVVLAKYPQLRPQHRDAEEFSDGFESAFERVGYLGRSALPDQKHYVNFWASEAKDWLANFRPGHRGDVAAGYLPAIIAHGDICFTPADPQQGICWSVGVTNFGGRQASDGWRKVLSGELMLPVMRRYA